MATKEEKLLNGGDILTDETEEEKKENVEPSQNSDSAEEVGREGGRKERLDEIIKIFTFSTLNY